MSGDGPDAPNVFASLCGNHGKAEDTHLSQYQAIFHSIDCQAWKWTRISPAKVGNIRRRHWEIQCEHREMQGLQGIDFVVLQDIHTVSFCGVSRRAEGMLPISIR